MKTCSRYFFLSGIPVLLAAMILLLVSGCDIKKNNKETDPKATFTRIYENNDFSQAFLPLDVKQAADGGFIILSRMRISESPFFGVYVMKTNAMGEFVSEQKISSDIVNPIPNLMKFGQTYYFFAMDRITLEARLMQTDDNGNTQIAAPVPGVIYPLYASLDDAGGQFILQHYDRDNKRTVISSINTSGGVSAQKEFPVSFGDFDIEQPLIDHLTGNGKRLPFLTGTVGGGTYFFNGFYNYNLSTLFFNFSSSSPGVVLGYKDQRCISSLMFLDGNRFALSRYDNGNNYISANTDISYGSGALSNSVDLKGNQMLEFTPDAQVVLKKLQAGGRNMLAFNSDTKSRRICFYFYDESSGNLLGTRYFGFSDPCEVGNFINTSDGGMALIGTTYLAGRFPRILLSKISKEDMDAVGK